MAAKKTANQSTEATPAKKAAKKAAKKEVAAKVEVATETEVAATSAPKPAKKAAAKPATTAPSPDAVARVAYMNYRKRVEQGLPGDSHTDWLEAERQLTKPS